MHDNQYPPPQLLMMAPVHRISDNVWISLADWLPEEHLGVLCLVGRWWYRLFGPGDGSRHRLTLRLRYVRCRLDTSGSLARERCQRMCPRVHRLVVDGIDSPGLLTLSQHLSNAPLLDTVILRSRDRSFGVGLTSPQAAEALHHFCSRAPQLRTVYMEMRIAANEEVQAPVQKRLLPGMSSAGGNQSVACCTPHWNAPQASPWNWPVCSRRMGCPPHPDTCSLVPEEGAAVCGASGCV